MSQRPDDAFEAFRKANPINDSTLPGPDSPKGRTLFDRITSAPRLSDPTPRRSRHRTVLVITAVLVALISIAATWLALRDVTDPLPIVCYQAPRMDSDAAAGASGGTLGVERCEWAWEDGTLINDDFAPPGQIPPLVGCVTDEGNLAVFPGDDPALCEQLGLTRPEPASMSDGDALRQLESDLVDWFDEHGCQALDVAEQDIRVILDAHGFDDWLISNPGPNGNDPCASFGLDVENKAVRLVSTPDLG